MKQVIETSERQRKFPFASSIAKQTGWLYSLPVSRSQYSDPVREEFSPAEGIDNRSWVVRRWRDDINIRFQYETFPGYLHIQLAGIVIPAQEIKKLLEKEQLLAGDEVDIFIDNIRSAFRIYRQEIELALEREAGTITERHPLFADFTLKNDVQIINVILYTADLFFAEKKEKIRAFIEKYREELMTVRVVRKFTVIRAE